MGIKIGISKPSRNCANLVPSHLVLTCKQDDTVSSRYCLARHQFQFVIPFGAIPYRTIHVNNNPNLISVIPPLSPQTFQLSFVSPQYVFLSNSSLISFPKPKGISLSILFLSFFFFFFFFSFFSFFLLLSLSSSMCICVSHKKAIREFNAKRKNQIPSFTSVRK